MAQTYLVDKVTVAQPRDAVVALAWACQALDGRAPSPAGLACHVAQSALETGHWKSCHWWNFGNVKASPSYGGFVTFFGCNEVLVRGGKRRVYWFHPTVGQGWPGHQSWLTKHPTSSPNDSQCCWRAYRTIEEGAKEQLAFLARRKRYARAWAAGTAGDPAAFSMALHAAGYYTANPATYTKTLVSLFHKYLPLATEAAEALELPEASSVPALAVMQEPEPQHDERKALQLDDAWLSHLPLEIPWDDMRAARNAAMEALNDADY